MIRQTAASALARGQRPLGSRVRKINGRRLQTTVIAIADWAEEQEPREVASIRHHAGGYDTMPGVKSIADKDVQMGDLLVIRESAWPGTGMHLGCLRVTDVGEDSFACRDVADQLEIVARGGMDSPTAEYIWAIRLP